VGEAIETLYPDRLEGFYGLLAHHFSLGGQPDKAIEYYRQESRQAVAVYAYDEAAQNLRAAHELMDPGTQSAGQMILFEELADVYRLVRDFTQAISLYRQALDVWRNLADGEEIVAVRMHRKIVQLATEAKWNMDLDQYRQASQIALESRASLEDSLGALQDESAHTEIVRALATLSFDAWRNQIPPDWERAQRFAQEAVDMAERLDDPVILSQALGALANILDGRSLLREYLQVAQRRLEISKDARLEDPSEGIDALNGVGMALMYVGEYTQAMPHLREAETLAASVQAIGQQTVALGLQGQCWFRLDRWDEVFAMEERWRDLERRYPRQRTGPT
jgi:tetratricopeptide (TPR) repeat protein